MTENTHHHTVDHTHTAAVITGTAREGRVGDHVADWVADRVAAHPGFTATRLDARDHHDDPDGPGHERRSEILADADAVVIVTGEYNHSFPAPLKALIDAHRDEWYGTPVAIVSYGARAGGVRAAEALRLVFPELHSMTVRDSLAIPAVWERVDDHGFRSDPGLDRGLDGMLDTLLWWTRTLALGREEFGDVA